MMERASERVLHALKAAGPQTAAVLARRLGVTAVAARQHLARLAEDGLVAFEDRREGVGRPKRAWSLTAVGHGRFPDSHAVLTVELIAAAGQVFGPEGLERLIAVREKASLAQYRGRLAGKATLPARVKALAAIRSEEGYMAEMRRDADGTLWLIENHCPVCAAAKVCQGLCRSELAIFRRVLGPAAEVKRKEHLLGGARRCAYRIRETGVDVR